MAERARGWRRVSIGTRLALAFLLVAWLAIGLLTALAVVSARRSVEDLAAREREEAVATLVRTLEDAYREADGWAGVTLPPTATPAGGSGLVIRDDSGAVVTPHAVEPSQPPDGHSTAPSTSPTPTSKPSSGPSAGPTTRPSTGPVDAVLERAPAARARAATRRRRCVRSRPRRTSRCAWSRTPRRTARW